jgi:hypothetical protein
MLVEFGWAAGCVVLDSYPGQLVVAISVRAQWEKEDFPADIGEEGVWYRNENYDVVKFEPFKKEEHLWFYDIKPFGPHQSNRMITHQFLARVWNPDVYLPALTAKRFTVVEHDHEGSPYWEFRSEKAHVSGFTIED